MKSYEVHLNNGNTIVIEADKSFIDKNVIDFLKSDKYQRDIVVARFFKESFAGFVVRDE